MRNLPLRIKVLPDSIEILEATARTRASASGVKPQRDTLNLLRRLNPKALHNTVITHRTIKEMKSETDTQFQKYSALSIREQSWLR